MVLILNELSNFLQFQGGRDSFPPPPTMQTHKPTDTIYLSYSIVLRPLNRFMGSDQTFDFWLIVTPCALPPPKNTFHI